ncbi:MAG TPA: CHAT domain-containing protein [Thermoanaerobaculia bacterium]|nr:CHAT domain-containing protein [Thermoanaerobaculia bacterium]
MNNRLRRSQAPNGSWNAEIWDTAWAAQALLDAGAGNDDSAIKRAVSFVAATQDEIRGFWYGEPFETMIALDLLRQADPVAFANRSPAAIDWLMSLQSTDGRVIAPHFTGVFAALFSMLRSRDFKFGAAAERATQWLAADVLEHGIWTSAAWSNAHALIGLLDSNFDRQDIITRAADWFLDHQKESGSWLHVAEVDDTAMSILALARLLTIPLVDVAAPRTGSVTAVREDGALRVTFEAGAATGVIPAERFKLASTVRDELRNSQRHLVNLGVRLRATEEIQATPGNRDNLRTQLTQLGRYAYGHLLPRKTRDVLESWRVDHVRLTIDEQLIDLPWEILHDGEEFLCLKYAIARRIYSEETIPLREPPKRKLVKMLIVSDPTDNLPGAEREGSELASLLRDSVDVTHISGRSITRRDFLLGLEGYDIVHYAGHATSDTENPDESCLVFHDGVVRAFEITGFLDKVAPQLVFLNACWSAAETTRAETYSSLIRGLGRTFLFAGVAAYVGYLIPVADEAATQFAITFYQTLREGFSIGESLRRSRAALARSSEWTDLTWASAVLYGSPEAKPFNANQRLA